MCKTKASTHVALSMALQRIGGQRREISSSQACVHSGQLGSQAAAPDLKLRALKQVRHVNREPENTPPLCSRRRLHVWQATSGESSKRLPGNGLGRLTGWPAALR